MNRTATTVLRAVYGGPAVLLDESALLRDALGPLLARAAAADFAVARFRLEAIDLHADELRGLDRCRLLVERLKGVTEGDALAASREEVAARLALLQAFLESGRVEVRAAGGQSWTPDFSVMHGVRRADGTVLDTLGVLGAHYFSRPYPVMGPALTCFVPDPAAADLLARRFEELWASGYDVAFVLAERIGRLLGVRGSLTVPGGIGANGHGTGARTMREEHGANRQLQAPPASLEAWLKPASLLRERLLEGSAVEAVTLENAVEPASAAAPAPLLFAPVPLPPAPAPAPLQPEPALAQASDPASARAPAPAPASPHAPDPACAPLHPRDLPITFVAPAAAARAALAARFGPRPDADLDGGDSAAEPDGSPPTCVLDLAAFQRDAVRRARQALARHRGVVLADEVGLGKTFVALALVEDELRAGGRALIAAPAALRREWLLPLRRLAKAYATSLLRGTDAGARELVPDETSRPRLAWTTHGALSRGGRAVADFVPTLVVVDEAHAFRNPHTRRYRALAASCRGARVVAVSATPLNNLLWDLYFQIRLFAPESACARQGVPDLRRAFQAGVGGDGGAIVPVLREVVVRRTRPFLRDHYGAFSLPGTGTLSLPRRAEPTPVRYDLPAALPGGMEGVADVLENLRLAPYRLPAYGGRARGQDTAGELLRVSLLKRLESSAAAFRASVRALAGYLESFERALLEGRLLRPRERVLVEAEQLVLGAVALDALPPGTDVRRLAADVRADLVALQPLLEATRETTDPKLARLRELLLELGEPCVVFTEFRETARHLARGLASFRRGLVHGGGAWLGDAAIGRRELIERFAPRANGAAAPPAHERVDVLIATDVLAEGLNLQDARCIVSYDLPWNPVRLMQRIGRVDRLGSLHAKVRPYHFVPAAGLEELLGVMRRIRRKLRMIRQALPGDAAVLDGPATDDHLLLRVLAGDAAALDAAEWREYAPYEVEERLRRLWLHVQRLGRSAAPATPPPAEGLFAGLQATSAIALPCADTPPPPPRAIGPLAAAVDVSGLTGARVLVCLDGPAPAWLVWDAPAGSTRTAGPERSDVVAETNACGNGPHGVQNGRELALDHQTAGAVTAARDDDLAAAEIVSAALEAHALLEPDPELVRAAEAAARAALAARDEEPPPGAHGVVATASKRLLRELASSRHRPDPAVCARADLLLARLARGVTAGEEMALRRALARRGDPPQVLLAQLEQALDPPAQPLPEPQRACWRLVAAIEARPASGRGSTP